MSCKINAVTIAKLLSGLTDYFDSLYRGKLYSITSFSVKSGCSEFDNFLSSIYKVETCTQVFGVERNNNESEECKRNLICKSTIVEEDGFRDNLEKYYWNILFTKEKEVYDFLQSLGSKLGTQIWQLSPRMHHAYVESESYSCLLLDDLVSMDYYIPKTVGEGLSFQECQLIIKNLARLHCLSLVVEGKEGCRFSTKYEICSAEMLFSSSLESAIRPLTCNSFEGFLRLTEKFRQDLFPHLKKIDDDENIWNRLCELVKPGKSSFSCMCHGDPRLNNIFIEKKLSTSSTTSGEEEPGLRFIDFQLTRYASPITDLQYVLHMGTRREFREKHTTTLLETYYNEFKSVLGRFPDVKLEQWEAIESWTLDTLVEEYSSFSMYGFLVSVILLPMILLRPGDIDKSTSKMTKAERTQFFKDGRADLVFNVGCRNEELRERLFEMCDEMVAKNIISSTTNQNIL